MTKPPASNVLALGVGEDPSGRTYVGLLVQFRTFYNNKPDARTIRNAGKYSIWGEHARADESALTAALRCCRQEFLRDDIKLGPESLICLGGPVETEHTMNTLFFLCRKMTWGDITCREGAPFFLPLDQVELHLRHGLFSESTETLMRALHLADFIESLCNQMLRVVVKSPACA